MARRIGLLDNLMVPRFKELDVYKQEQELKILSILLDGASIDKLQNESDDDYRARCFREMNISLPGKDVKYLEVFSETYRTTAALGARIIRRRTFDLVKRSKNGVGSSTANGKNQKQGHTIMHQNLKKFTEMWSAPREKHFMTLFKGLPVDKQEEEIKILSTLLGGAGINMLANESSDAYRARIFEEMFTQLPSSSLYPEAFRDTYECCHIYDNKGYVILRIRTSDLVQNATDGDGSSKS